MANELKFGNKVVFLNGLPFTLPMASSDPLTATNGDMYYNTSVDMVKVYQGGVWTFLSSGSSVSSGTAGQLALYSANGSNLGPNYVQSAFNISVNIAPQPGRSSALAYTFPNPGDSVSSANILLSEGAQMINGAQTFSGALTLSSLTASLPLLLDASKNIVSAAVSLTSQVSGVLPIANGGTNSSTALNNNRVLISSGSAIVEQSAISGNRALASDINGLPVASTTTDTELGYVSGVTSAIQTQLNAKLASALAQNHIFVGSVSNLATDVAMSGEASIVASGAVTLSNAAVIAKVLTGYAASPGTVTSSDSILSALEKIDGNDGLKVLKAGDTMTGNLAMSSNKVTGLGAATTGGDAVRYEQAVLVNGVNAFTADQSMGNNKLTNLANGTNANDAVNFSQLQAVSNGNIWLNPVQDPDLIDDSLSTPPVSPVDNTVYIISTAPTGAWSSIGAGHVVYYSGGTWHDVLGRAIQVGDRFGITLDHGSGFEGGNMAGNHNKILQVTNATPGSYAYSIHSPVLYDSVFVNQSNSQHFSHSYNYNGTSWVEIAGPGVITTGSALAFSGNTLNVQYDNSTIDLNGFNQLEVKAGGITNTQINTSAAIAYSKLNLSASIVNADIATGAAIVYSKLNLTGSIVNADVSSSAAIVYSKLSLSNSIVDSDINTAAAIAYSKLAALTINRALQSDGSGVVSVSTTTSTELGFLSGVTSSIQTQLNGKANSALSNLASVAINTSLLPGSDNTIDVGSASFRWSSVHSLNHLLYGSTSGAITLSAANTTTSYTVKWPSAQGAASSLLLNDGSGNLSWKASASAATASTVMTRDANANTQINNVVENFSTTPTAATTTTLTVASSPLQQFTGSTTQNLALPDATTLFNGTQYQVFNRSTGAVTVKDGSGSTIQTISGGAQAIFTLASNSTIAGSWDITYTIPGTTAVNTIGSFDGQAGSANGLVISGNSLFAQSATASVPGMINTGTQTFAGAKTFNTSVATPSFLLNGSSSGAITMNAGTSVTSYSITWPSAQGGASTVLQNNGSGVLSWASTAGFANTALSNLSSVAINTNLLPGSDNTINLGSASFRWSNVHALNQLLYGSTSGAITLSAANTTTSYTVKWPSAQGGSSTVLQNDGSGNLSWATSTGFSGRAGFQSISNTSTSQAVTFSSTLGTTNYGVVASIRNTTDANPQFQPVTITAKSATGFTATWNAPTDSANYVLEFVAIPNA